MKANRKFMCEDLRGYAGTLTGNMNCGEWQVRYWDGDCSIQQMCWRDNAIVNLVSSHPEITVGSKLCDRHRWTGDVAIDRPDAYEDYSAFMAGTYIVDATVDYRGLQLRSSA